MSSFCEQKLVATCIKKGSKDRPTFTLWTILISAYYHTRKACPRKNGYTAIQPRCGSPGISNTKLNEGSLVLYVFIHTITLKVRTGHRTSTGIRKRPQ